MCECVSDCLPIAAQIMSHCGFACQADGGISSAVYGHAPAVGFSAGRGSGAVGMLSCGSAGHLKPRSPQT